MRGRRAAASLASLAAEGDGRAAEAAHEMAWEQLHSAPWHAVHPAWRDAYALSCLHLAAHHDARDALRVLDMGLLMGGRLLKPRLHSAISQAQQRLSVEEIKSSSGPFPSHDDDGHDDDDGACPFLTSTLEKATPFASSHLSSSSKNLKEKLPRGSLSCEEVTRRVLLTVEDFLCKFFIQCLPVIITNAMTHWPAMTKWRNMGYLMEVVGNRTVPVEVGEHYLASGWKQELMTMLELLKKLQVPECPSSERAYLAQHPLFEQIPKLREDIIIPDYCAATGGELQVINAWLGPNGTVTPLHHDPHHNLLSQVVGRKYVRLYSPDASSGMYPYGEAMLSNSSQVDLDIPDYTKFPLAENLSFMDCILEEGEMLYIPPKWWHYVRSLSLSFSVSFWWSDMDNK